MNDDLITIGCQTNDFITIFNWICKDEDLQISTIQRNHKVSTPYDFTKSFRSRSFRRSVSFSI